MRVHLAQTFVSLSLHQLFVPLAIFQAELIFLLVGPAIFLGFTPLTLTFVQRGRRQINIPLFQQRTHTTEKERQQQCGNVRPVHIGIGHNNDFMIAQFLDIRLFRIFFRPDSHPQSLEHITDFLTFEDLVIHRFFHIQYLTAQR